MKRRSRNLRLRAGAWMLSGLIVIGIGVFMTARSYRWIDQISVNAFGGTLALASWDGALAGISIDKEIVMDGSFNFSIDPSPFEADRDPILEFKRNASPGLHRIRLPWILVTGLPAGGFIYMGIRRWRSAQTIKSESASQQG